MTCHHRRCGFKKPNGRNNDGMEGSQRMQMSLNGRKKVADRDRRVENFGSPLIRYEFVSTR